MSSRFDPLAGRTGRPRAWAWSTRPRRRRAARSTWRWACTCCPTPRTTGRWCGYGTRVYDEEVRADGSKITLQPAFGPHEQAITARHWTRATLERALTEAGFTDIGWPGYGVSPEGVREHGEELWSAYPSLPHASVITCRKGAAG